MSGVALDFDANASSPVRPAAWRAYVEALGAQATSGGAWAHGWPGESPRAIGALAEARRDVAAALGAGPDEVFFTSGGTAANALALAAAVAADVAASSPDAATGPTPVVVSALEHAAVVNAARVAAARGALQLCVWPASPDGLVELAAAEATLAKRPRLVSVLLAHNETGALQPLEEVVRRAHGVGAAVHTDAVQAVGRLSVDFGALAVDMLSLSGHKFGAVGGVGALLVRRGTAVHGALRATHACPRAVRCAAAWVLERGAVAATRNLPGVLSLAAAVRELPDAATLARIRALRDGLEATVVGALGPAGCRVLAAASPRLAHVSCLHLVGVPAEAVLMALDVAGYAVSAGAACASGALEASPSLRAMGLSAGEAREVVRVSLPSNADPVQVRALAAAVVDCARRARDVDG